MKEKEVDDPKTKVDRFHHEILAIRRLWRSDRSAVYMIILILLVVPTVVWILKGDWHSQKTPHEGNPSSNSISIINNNFGNLSSNANGAVSELTNPPLTSAARTAKQDGSGPSEASSRKEEKPAAQDTAVSSPTKLPETRVSSRSSPAVIAPPVIDPVTQPSSHLKFVSEPIYDGGFQRFDAMEIHTALGNELRFLDEQLRSSVLKRLESKSMLIDAAYRKRINASPMGYEAIGHLRLCEKEANRGSCMDEPSACDALRVFVKYDDMRSNFEDAKAGIAKCIVSAMTTTHSEVVGMRHKRN